MKLFNYIHEPTADPDLFRIVDRWGDWNYYFKKSENRIIPAVNYILNVADNKGEGFARYLLNHTPEEARQNLQETGDVGKRVHMAIRDILLGVEITQDTTYPNEITGRQERLAPEEWDALCGFANFVEDYKPQTILNDHAISTKDYAGTPDWYCTVELVEKDGRGKNAKEVTKRIFVVIDFKKTAGIYDAHRYQTAAYREPIKKSKELPGGQHIHTGILRLGTRHKRQYEFKTRMPKEADHDYKMFLNNLGIFMDKIGDFKLEILEIPASFKLDVPYYKPEAKKKKASKTKKK